MTSVEAMGPNPNEQRLTVDQERLSIANALGKLDHFLKYVEQDPTQPEFSACFDVSNAVHIAMHEYFLDALKGIGDLDLTSPEIGTVQVMQHKDVRLFRQGIEGFVFKGDRFEPSGEAQTIIYFASRY